MARKSSNTVQAKPAPHEHPQAAPKSSEPEIVPDGDYAGMRTADVMRALTEQLHEVVGEVSIEAACASFDMALGELLAVAQYSNGDEFAKMAGIKFCETALPFALLPVETRITYNEARKVKGHRR